MIDAIYNEDCLEGMKRIPDGAVDFVLTDLPFGITDCPFDVRLPFEPMWEQFKRVTKKNAAIVLFSQMPFGAELIMSNRKMFRYEWIYEKCRVAGYLNANKMPLRCHENIFVFYRELPTYNPQKWYSKSYRSTGKSKWASKNYINHNRIDNINTSGERYPRDVIKWDGVTARKGTVSFHAQQKPTDLLEYLIKTYTNEGELVLDATIGSGSTAVAAINTGRHFIGFETEKKFYDIANERIAKAYEEKAMRLME